MASTQRITRAAQLESLQDFRVFLKQHCTGVAGINDETLYDVQLAIDEACTNIISHGYRDIDPGSIILDLELAPGKLTVCLTDFGHSFEPSTTPMPDVDAPIEERELGGFGLFFIQQSMDAMDYQVTEDGNKMSLTKYLNPMEDSDEHRSDARTE
jgi:serine/threonine-protein kinase RsbW